MDRDGLFKPSNRFFLACTPGTAQHGGVMSRAQLTFSEVIPPKAAVAWSADAGQIIRITDLEGGQVGDLVLFARDDLRDRVSISWTRTRNIRTASTYEPPLGLAPGNTIWSTGYRALATVVEDTSPVMGVHDLYGRMCNRGMYEMYGVTPQDGCYELLQDVLTPHGVAPAEIPDAIGVFMNTQPDPETRVMRIHQPVTRPDDSISIRVEMDLLAAMSTCPMDVLAPTNSYHITPMKVEVFTGRS